MDKNQPRPNLVYRFTPDALANLRRVYTIIEAARRGHV